jgi:nitrite reductase (NADH) small subunit
VSTTTTADTTAGDAARGGAAASDGQPQTRWTRVCALTDLVPERGVAALVDGVQVALFRLDDDSVLAVQQHDPFSGANVISRGLVGSVRDVPVVSSPMFKQVWVLATGECLDPGGKEPRDLTTYPVSVEDGEVLVGPAVVP